MQIECRISLTADELTELQRKFTTIFGRLERMATQSDVDALVAAVDVLGTDLTTAVAGIQSDLDALKAANPGVDLGALTASIGALSTAVSAAKAVDAENPPVV
jgi:hypothetical protein